MHLTLASQSPRRRELLAGLGIPVVVRPACTDERPLPGEPPPEYVRRVAAEKTEVVDGEVVLGADTAVVLGDRILGKPENAEDARNMLRQLSGRSHTVLTGVCVRRRGGPVAESVVASQVHFAPLSDAAIDWYVGTGEPLDKAGAYAVQGAGGAFVREISGSVSNVVGLPLAETLELLRRIGFPLPWEEP
jgi:septum formation protein